MNSGKSTALLQVAYNYEERGMNVLLVKAAIDTKGDDKVQSRLGIERKVDILAKESINLYDSIVQWHKDVEKVSCVLVDEAQFLAEEQVNQLLQVVIKANIPVICYGIRTDFQVELFPGSKRLFAVAHTIEELKTICRCGKKAMMNGRKIDGEFTFDGDQVAIDGAQDLSYESLCGSCYFDELRKTIKSK